MGLHKIKSFSIYRLFGTHDVHIPFENDIKILIGENGLGKTQVLNLLYYTLTKDFIRLSDFNFDKLVLNFSNGKHIILTKDSINELIKKTYKNPIIKDLVREIGVTKFDYLRRQFAQNERLFRNDERLFQSKILRRYSSGMLQRAFEEISLEQEKSEKESSIKKWQESIENGLKNLDILYFPTFRRVEEDFHNIYISYDDKHIQLEDDLIQFGMQDVKKKFNQIENKIETLLKEGLSNFLKDVLKIVINNNANIDESIFDRINQEDLDIIFARAKNLDKEIKDAILESVNQRKFNSPFAGLILQKLVELYENQKELDNSVIVFRNICNKYLINKEVFYDESQIKIYIKSTITGDEIELSKLSSGEKQIISIFTKIYFAEKEQRFVILFDEPELSLSIIWQKQLLPDIVNSKKCDFLLAVTHSPFIFDNELDKYAVGLNEYFSPSPINQFL